MASSSAPAGAKEAQLTLHSLVESMSAEAASLQRHLGRLSVGDSSAGAPALAGGSQASGEPRA
jgi:hypothetical protein